MRNMFDIGNETVIVTTEIGKILVSETELPLESRCFHLASLAGSWVAG
jgi:hypothetical protein